MATRDKHELRRPGLETRRGIEPSRSLREVLLVTRHQRSGSSRRSRGRSRPYSWCRARGGPARATCRLAGLVVSRRMDPHATRPALEGGRGAPVRDPGRARTGGTGEERAGRRCRRSTARSHGRNRREGGPSTGGRNSHGEHRRTVPEPPGSGRPRLTRGRSRRSRRSGRAAAQRRGRRRDRRTSCRSIRTDGPTCRGASRSRATSAVSRSRPARARRHP
jgi:hypothetical protein